MNEREANTLTDMVKDHWQMFMSAPTRALWVSYFLTADAEIATKAIAALAADSDQKSAPRISDVKETIRLLTPKPELPALPAAKEKPTDTPEWVWVWSWARFHRSPRLLRPFPQQDGYVDMTSMLTTSEYEGLRQEWIAAGRPKAEHPLPLAR